MHGTLRRQVDQPKTINDYANADNDMGINNGVSGVTLSPSALFRRCFRAFHLMLL